MIDVGGGARTGLVEGIDLGKRVKYDKWNDDQVVEYLLVHFYDYRNLVLLSADLGWDAQGLRTIIHNQVKPVLQSASNNYLGLNVLLKKGKTAIQTYADEVIKFCTAHLFEADYTEVLY